MNRNFGKLTDGNLVYAPDTIRNGRSVILNPGIEDYLAAGYKPVIDERPYTAPNEYAVPAHWEETETAISRFYEIRPIEPTPRRWTPLTMKRAAVAKKWWGTFKVVLEKFEAYEDFLMCQFIAEDDPMFAPIYKELCSRYGEEEVKKYLDTMEVE